MLQQWRKEAPPVRRPCGFASGIVLRRYTDLPAAGQLAGEWIGPRSGDRSGGGGGAIVGNGIAAPRMDGRRHGDCDRDRDCRADGGKACRARHRPDAEPAHQWNICTGCDW
jgi:hypothetical protein